MKTAVKNADAVTDAIRRALKVIATAQREANEDTRTSSGTVCWELDQAAAHIQAADNWLRELKAEERAPDKATPVPPKPKAKTPRECGCCDTAIPDDDLVICSGCDQPTCPACLSDAGDGSCCVECAGEE